MIPSTGSMTPSQTAERRGVTGIPRSSDPHSDQTQDTTHPCPPPNCRQATRQTDPQTNRQTDGQIPRQTDPRQDRPPDRRTDPQTDGTPRKGSCGRAASRWQRNASSSSPIPQAGRSRDPAVPAPAGTCPGARVPRGQFPWPRGRRGWADSPPVSTVCRATSPAAPKQRTPHAAPQRPTNTKRLCLCPHPPAQGAPLCGATNPGDTV